MNYLLIKLATSISMKRERARYFLFSVTVYPVFFFSLCPLYCKDIQFGALEFYLKVIFHSVFSYSCTFDYWPLFNELPEYVNYTSCQSKNLLVEAAPAIHPNTDFFHVVRFK